MYTLNPVDRLKNVRGVMKTATRTRVFFEYIFDEKNRNVLRTTHIEDDTNCLIMSTKPDRMKHRHTQKYRTVWTSYHRNLAGDDEGRV